MVGTETGRLIRISGSQRNPIQRTPTSCFLRSMREIVAAAEKLGVIVGVEGVFNHTLYSPARMKRFLEDIDSPMWR